MRLGFQQTLIDHVEQCRWPEGLAQTTRCAEFGGHALDVGARNLQIGKGMAGNSEQRHRRRALVEQSDRLEAAYIGHEHVDNHEVEGRIIESGKTVRAAVCDRDPEAVLRQPGTNGQADMRIVVDNQNTGITASLPLAILPGPCQR